MKSRPPPKPLYFSPPFASIYPRPSPPASSAGTRARSCPPVPPTPPRLAVPSFQLASPPVPPFSLAKTGWTGSPRAGEGIPAVSPSPLPSPAAGTGAHNLKTVRRPGTERSGVFTGGIHFRNEADIARRAHRHRSRSVMTCQYHGQVRRTSCGPISAGGRRHDEHHRVIVSIAAGFRSGPTDGPYPSGATFGVHSE